MDALASHRRRIALPLLAVVALVMLASPANAGSSNPDIPALVCPPLAPGPLPHHQRAGVVTAMVPGHPRRLLGCRYHGLNQPQRPGTLATSKTLPAGRIASDLNRAPIVARNGPVPSCPADFGDQSLLIFRYPDRTQLLVTVETSGCLSATNGTRVAH